MEKLPENWYSAIQMNFLEGKNGEQICQELGITNTNFWQILYRAKLQLRKNSEIRNCYTSRAETNDGHHERKV